MDRRREVEGVGALMGDAEENEADKEAARW